MKIIAFTPVYKRREILEIWLEGIRRLQGICDITPFVMVSNREDCDFAHQNSLDYCLTPNQPLGAKQNNGLNELRNVEFDYICQISSDVLLSNEGLRELMDCTPNKVAGFSTAYFYDTVNKRALQFTKTKSHRCIGAARIIHRDILEANDWKMWDDHLHKNLDRSSEERMKGVYFDVIDKPLVVGIKSELQITPYDLLTPWGEPATEEDVFSLLSDKEIEMIKAL